MNLKKFITVLASTAFFAHGVNADPKSLPPALPPTHAPWIATDRDVVGNWEMRGGELAWEITFNADHTLSVYHEGIGGLGPYTSTWKLVLNHVILDGKYVYHGPGSGADHYKPPPMTFDYGNDLEFIRVNGNSVLLPSGNVAIAQKYDFAPSLCFWHYTLQHGVDTLPQEAIDRDKAAYKQMQDEQKSRRNY